MVMLEEYKQIVKSSADRINGWEKLSKTDLFRKCVEHEDNDYLYNSYFAAIQYRYWSLIGKYYQMCDGLITPETCLDWVVDAITYALKHKRWLDEDSSIFNDPNGPDKVINRWMKCNRANLYQYTNRKKRKDSFGVRSLEDIVEKVNDNTYDLEDKELSLDPANLDIQNYISTVFHKKEYFLAFMVDMIMTRNVFRYSEEQKAFNFDKKKLARQLCKFDDKYISYFSEQYNLDLEDVQKSVEYMSILTPRRALTKVERSLLQLKNNKYMMSLRG